MNILASHAHPVSYASLRSLLKIVDDAGVRGDTATLENARNVIPPLDGDVRTNCLIYINGLIEVIDQNEITSVYSEADVTAARLSLERAAYGNFDEAMHVLGRDLLALDPAIVGEIGSDIFRPEFFDPEDREIWNDLRQVIDKYKARPSGDYSIEAYQAYRALREYQQKSYGPLLPAMVATYKYRDGSACEGVSVRLAWVDGALNIVAVEPLANILNEYFADRDMVVEADDFTEACVPAIIADYRLMDVARADVYRHEL